MKRRKKKRKELLLLVLLFKIAFIFFSIQYAFGSKLKNQFILLFNLFLLLFMDSTTLFITIYEFHCTISTNFYLQYITFNKIFLVSAK